MYRTGSEEDSGVLLKPFIDADSAFPDSQESHRGILKHYMAIKVWQYYGGKDTCFFDNLWGVS